MADVQSSATALAPPIVPLPTASDSTRQPPLLQNGATDDAGSVWPEEKYSDQVQRGKRNGLGDSERLIDRIIDPTAWLMNFRFREDWNWPVRNSGPDTQTFEFRPTIPFVAWNQVNLLRVTVPYDIRGASGHGLGDIRIWDLVVFDADWGRWGVGPVVHLAPNASDGQDTFAVGPVFGAASKSKHWTAGFLSVNWFSGNVSESRIQPILAYKFNDQFALSIGEMEFRYNWHDAKWTQLPSGCQLDYISDLWGQKIHWFINPQYNFERASSNSGWTVFVGFSLLVPGA